ncbi:MAG: hypothetical protein ACRCTZ_23190, partial [Sarcina sp.]
MKPTRLDHRFMVKFFHEHGKYSFIYSTTDRFLKEFERDKQIYADIAKGYEANSTFHKICADLDRIIYILKSNMYTYEEFIGIIKDSVQTRELYSKTATKTVFRDNKKNYNTG